MNIHQFRGGKAITVKKDKLILALCQLRVNFFLLQAELDPSYSKTDNEQVPDENIDSEKMTNEKWLL